MQGRKKMLRFNPCFDGMRKLNTSVDYISPIQKICFNPCFDGMRKLNLIGGKMTRGFWGFNPCFDGMRKLNIMTTCRNTTLQEVSILVLME